MCSHDHVLGDCFMKIFNTFLQGNRSETAIFRIEE
jgi:hypothetical protein